MAKKHIEIKTDLPGSTVITVVAENVDEIAVKDMTIDQANEMLKKKSFSGKKAYKYKFYQQGYCSIKPQKKNESKRQA